MIRFERLIFFLSATVLALAYGYLARTFHLPPHAWLDRASGQLARMLDPFGEITWGAVHGGSGARVHRPDSMQPGLTLVSTYREDGRPLVVLVEADGTVVHRWLVDSTIFDELTSDEMARGDPVSVHGMHLFPDGSLLVVLEYLGIARVDACGRVLWSLPNRAHHAVTRADDGTFWILVSEGQDPPSSDRYPRGYPGLDGLVHHDRVVRITEDGTVLSELSVLDVLFENGLERFLAKARDFEPGDLLHVNDVEPLPARLAADFPTLEAGDLAISIWSSDLLVVVDPETRRVRWHTSDLLVHQHDPDFLEGGWIGVFNNNTSGDWPGTLLGGSEIVAFQPHTDSVEVLFRSAATDPFYTPWLGKWQALGNGNLLLSEGAAGRVLEVTAGGEPVWEWIAATTDGDRVFYVREGTRYPFDPDSVGAWDCAVRRP